MRRFCLLFLCLLLALMLFCDVVFSAQNIVQSPKKKKRVTFKDVKDKISTSSSSVDHSRKSSASTASTSSSSDSSPTNNALTSQKLFKKISMTGVEVDDELKKAFIDLFSQYFRKDISKYYPFEITNRLLMMIERSCILLNNASRKSIIRSIIQAIFGNSSSKSFTPDPTTSLSLQSTQEKTANGKIDMTKMIQENIDSVELNLKTLKLDTQSKKNDLQALENQINQMNNQLNTLKKNVKDAKNNLKKVEITYNKSKNGLTEAQNQKKHLENSLEIYERGIAFMSDRTTKAVKDVQIYEVGRSLFFYQNWNANYKKLLNYAKTKIEKDNISANCGYWAFYEIDEAMESIQKSLIEKIKKSHRYENSLKEFENYSHSFQKKCSQVQLELMTLCKQYLVNIFGQNLCKKLMQIFKNKKADDELDDTIELITGKMTSFCLKLGINECSPKTFALQNLPQEFQGVNNFKENLSEFYKILDAQLKLLNTKNITLLKMKDVGGEDMTATITEYESLLSVAKQTKYFVEFAFYLDKLVALIENSDKNFKNHFEEFQKICRRYSNVNEKIFQKTKLVIENNAKMQQN